MKRCIHRGLLGSLLLSLGLLGGLAEMRDDPTAAARAEITETAKAFVEAYHKGDAKALAAFWTPDGDFTDLGGRVLQGREAIAADFSHLFAENKGLKLRIEEASLRFPTPDTAIEDGVTSVIAPGGGLPNRARYTNFLVKRDGRWLLESVRESAYVPPNNYQQLQPLEWTIGEWVEDVKEGHAGRVVFEWSPDRNFILASRAVEVDDQIVFNGSERIGWDPAAKLLRSWAFEADGGFGQGTWKAVDADTWSIGTSSVLRSGSLMTATSVVNRVDSDTITWQSTQRRLDGQPIADSPVITMKRAR